MPSLWEDGRMAEVSGFVVPGLEKVRDEFEANFAERGEVGAAVCAIAGGETVVDLWGGLSDPATGRPWRRDSLVNFYSAGKPLVACLVLRLVDAGLVDLDDPVASVWPAFSVGGKGPATVRQALSHRAGVPAIAADLTNEDLYSWDTMVDALAATPAWFEPGSRVVYHTNTYGHLVGEIARRVSGRMPGSLLASVAEEVGADVHFGLEDRDLDRCAVVILEPNPALAAGQVAAADGSDDAMVRRGYFNPPGYSSFGVVNTAAWRQAQIPSTNGHGSAAGLAGFYQALLQPGRVLSDDLTREATRVQAEGDCPVLGEWAAFGLGFVPTSPRRRFGPNEGSFGHFGTGGAVGFADPAGGIAFGYVMNHVIPRWQSTRNRALIDALYLSMSSL
jgi:CubicO group peptidase (beta-lactamase class C family)